LEPEFDCGEFPIKVTETTQEHWGRYRKKFESKKPVIKARIPWCESEKIHA